MLVTFGFLLAALLLLVVLPSYRRRVERLATAALRRSLPLTESEIRAEKDRLRAEYAINLHRLERNLDEASYSAARQSIEINRREAKINDLELAIAGHKGSVEEHENARRVLEQAILDRLPKVEQRLADTRKLLAERDAEIAKLSQSSVAQTSALEEATQINVQQSGELERLRTALETRAARNRDTIGDPRFDGEVALRTEIEMLRAKSRDQADMIERLQVTVGGAGDEGGGGLAADAARLRSELAKAESELLTLKMSQGSPASGNAVLEARVRELEAQDVTRSAELAKLKAAVKSYETSAAHLQPTFGSGALSAKAEIGALQAQVDEQTRLIQSLRSEVASSNQRLARQSQHFRDELRRLGSAGLVQSDDPARRGAEPRRPSLAERIAQPRAPQMSAIGQPANEAIGAAAAAAFSGPISGSGASGSSALTGAGDEAASSSATSKVSYLKAVNGSGDNSQAEAANDASPASANAQKRSRLLDRIASVDKQ